MFPDRLQSDSLEFGMLVVSAVNVRYQARRARDFSAAGCKRWLDGYHNAATGAAMSAAVKQLDGGVERRGTQVHVGNERC